MLLYDQSLIEQLYLEYQCTDCNDSSVRAQLKNIFAHNKVLLIGPGKRCVSDSKRILTYMNNVHPIVIANNFIPANYKIDYIFLSNSKRYVQLASSLERQRQGEMEIIATSNITESGKPFAYILDYSKLLDMDGPIIDNSFLMLLNILEDMEIEELVLAGYDGYSTSGKENYYTKDMEYHFDADTAHRLNNYVSSQIKHKSNSIKIRFLTRSHYEIGS